MNGALEFRDVDVLFGEPRQQRVALEKLDRGATRAEIAAETGVMLGVAGASLAVAEGRIAVLMGLSGSGKSTLLRAANRLNPVTRGQVLVRDGDAMCDLATCDRQTLREVRRRRIAMVFQQFALLPWRTVRENVGLGLELRGADKAEIARIVDERLALVGLDQFAGKRVHELSGGMQQRVGLARAFATDADILLLDEPFSALDPLIRGKLQDELLELQRTLKKTMLFVTHDLDEALKLGDQVSVMEAGRIVQTGSGEDIVLRPATQYVADFVAHVNPLTIMTAGCIMQPMAALERDTIGIRFGDYRAQLDGSALHDGGTALPVVRHDVYEADGALTCDPGTPLDALAAAAARTAHPILVVSDGQLVGVCDRPAILGALAGRHAKPLS